MAKSDARFEYRAGLSRNDHDLSQPFTFTTTSGMLLPIWCDIASPGDSYYMQHDMPLLRSAVLAAPAMIDVKIHYETFFVPFQMIYQPLENAKFQLSNLQSSVYGSTPQLTNSSLPLLNYTTVLNNINQTYFNSSIRSDGFRLADLFGLQPLSWTNIGAQSSNGIITYYPAFFPWQLCAYHTIFNYYYRLDDKTQFYNTHCNIDYSFDQQYVVLNGNADVVHFFEIHQRPWDFDYFTSMYRSPIVSDANMQNILQQAAYSQNANLYPQNSSTLITNQQYKLTSTGASATNNVSLNTFSTNSSNVAANALQVNTANIRQLFANEKLAMITGRTRKNYDSQVLAHYGVKVPHDVKHDITMIHHDEYKLNVLEVTSLASTSDAPLGELAGKSYAQGNGKSFKFTAPCDGVIMTIFSVEPMRKYQAEFNRINAITNVFDLPTPEFDRLGNVPMFRYECSCPTGFSSWTNTDIIGWKERYYPFKRRSPRASYAFQPNGVYGPNTNDFSAFTITSHPFANVGRFATPLQPNSALPGSEASFYIGRGAMDDVSLVNFYDGWLEPTEEGSTDENWSKNPHLVYARDPFIVDSYIKCKKVSWMSKDGEPVYPW